jgi:hypothetical protein
MANDFHLVWTTPGGTYVLDDLKGAPVLANASVKGELVAQNSDTIYVGDMATGTVYSVPLAGGPSQTFATSLTGLRALLALNFDNVYVGMEGGVYWLDAGNPVLIGPTTSPVTGLAYGIDKRIYFGEVGPSGGAMHRVSTNGGVVDTFRTFSDATSSFGENDLIIAWSEGSKLFQVDTYSPGKIREWEHELAGARFVVPTINDVYVIGSESPTILTRIRGAEAEVWGKPSGEIVGTGSMGSHVVWAEKSGKILSLKFGNYF